MDISRFRLAPCLLLLGISAPVSAQQLSRDARCILVSSVFVNSANDDKARQLANQVRSFFLGRLDARATPAQISQSIAAERRNVSPANLAATMNSCADYVGKQGAAVLSKGR
jgi:hypothetical protein